MKRAVNTIALCVLVGLFSCASDDGHTVATLPVEIYEMNVPDEGLVNEPLTIHLKAQAGNGCYSNLKMEMVAIDNRRFLFRATGLFDSRGVCPDVMVYKDTMLTFTPVLTGEYFFLANEDGFEIMRDTLTVN